MTKVGIGRNLAGIGNMPQIEAHGLAHEQIERHLVHRLAVGADMPKRVDMRADAVDHDDEVRLKVIASPGTPRLCAFELSWLIWTVYTGR